MVIVASGQGNGNSGGVSIRAGNNSQGVKDRSLIFTGNFDGASVTVEVSPDTASGPQNRWTPLEQLVAQTAPISIEFLTFAERLRIVVSGGQGAESIDAEMF